jgi:hypothetical protein
VVLRNERVRVDVFWIVVAVEKRNSTAWTSPWRLVRVGDHVGDGFGEFAFRGSLLQEAFGEENRTAGSVVGPGFLFIDDTDGGLAHAADDGLEIGFGRLVSEVSVSPLHGFAECLGFGFVRGLGEEQSCEADLAQ